MSNDEERTCDDMWKDSLPASETPTCPGGNIEQRIVEALTTLEEICKTTMDEGSESDRRFLGLCIDRLCADPCQTTEYPNGEELADPKTIYRLLRLLVKHHDPSTLTDQISYLLTVRPTIVNVQGLIERSAATCGTKRVNPEKYRSSRRVLPSRIQIAMCYQRAGYTIIPVSSRNRASASGSDPRYFIDKARFSKGPLTADHVAVWWTQFPTADIGLVVGPPGDMMVVELKTHSANPAIFEGEWPRTPTIRTRTGVKMLFNFPSNMRLTSDIEISPNMVIRSTNDVTLLPPSRDSRGYKLRWILMPKSLEQALLLINTRYDGETCTVADPPKWLMDRLAPHLCTS